MQKEKLSICSVSLFCPTLNLPSKQDQKTPGLLHSGVFVFQAYLLFANFRTAQSPRSALPSPRNRHKASGPRPHTPAYTHILRGHVP